MKKEYIAPAMGQFAIGMRHSICTVSTVNKSTGYSSDGEYTDSNSKDRDQNSSDAWTDGLW